MNTGENEPLTADIWKIQWAKHARRRYASILTAGSSWSFTVLGVTSDAGLVADRELDEALELTASLHREGRPRKAKSNDVRQKN